MHEHVIHAAADQSITAQHHHMPVHTPSDTAQAHLQLPLLHLLPAALRWLKPEQTQHLQACASALARGPAALPAAVHLLLCLQRRLLRQLRLATADHPAVLQDPQVLAKAGGT
jgi:hypothetical protein